MKYKQINKQNIWVEKLSKKNYKRIKAWKKWLGNFKA